MLADRHLRVVIHDISEPLDGHILPAEEHVEGLEKEYITQALVRAGGVQVKAAELLGMTFRSFRYYAKKYNLK